MRLLTAVILSMVTTFMLTSILILLFGVGGAVVGLVLSFPIGMAYGTLVGHWYDDAEIYSAGRKGE